MISYSAATDIGKFRERNEDAHYVDAKRDIFLVADGMGGHMAGDVASKIAIDEAKDAIVSHLRNYGKSDKAGALDYGFAIADAEIRHRSKIDSECFAMGTTLLGCIVDRQARRAYLAHCGDTVAMLVHGNEVTLLTKPHNTPMGYLDRCLGGGPHMEYQGPSHIAVDLRAGDVLVLATDGLTMYLEDGDRSLADLVRGARAGTVAHDLVGYALRRGGRDNVTVVAIEVLQ